MWHAQVNTSLPWNPYFSPVGRPIAVSGRSGVGIQFCLADESNVPSGLELESCIVGQDRTPSRNVYIQNHRDWCSPLFLPPFSLSPAAAVHHKQDPSLRSLRPEFFLLFLFVFLRPLFPPLLGISSDAEMTNPSPGVWDTCRHNTSAWQTSQRVLVATQQCTGMTMNDLTA